jgi:GTPase SAR1 family protein
MNLDIDTKLNNTRSLLTELGNSVATLVNSSPDVFEDPSIKSSLSSFFAAYQEALQRLEKPSFRIATIGTTSSGKSTIVNALIGRRIAPIAAEEMSGGVLTIKHSLEHKLIIAETKDAAWETGEWIGLSDEDIYQRIYTVMISYHEARKKREFIAPQITVYVPTLPSNEFALLGLPQGIEIEFIDLPGLKSVQDRTNLSIIQQQVNKAFSLVSLDYMQIDDDHRRCLLEELKTVVEYLQGRTDSMIFILNRVDQRGADDLPLDVRINKLREEIQEVLSLPKLPDIIPFNARLLYYSQCAWGAGALNTVSTVDQKTRLQFLKVMFQDCASVIRLNVKENRDLRNWLREIEDQVEDNKFIDDETMLYILNYCFRWSGGQELWKCFRTRVEESFAQLVILPALGEVLNKEKTLSDELNVLIDARKIQSEEEVNREKDNINQIRQHLYDSSQKNTEKFKKDIKNWIEGLKSSDAGNISRVKQDAQKKGLNLEEFLETVRDIEKDLISSLVFPVVDALKKHKSDHDLEDKLSKVVSPPLARDIARTYGKLRGRLERFKSEPGFLVRRVRIKSEKVKSLEYDERYVRLLYSHMRDAIEARSNFLLQAKGHKFISALDKFIKDNCCINPSQYLTQLNDDQVVILSRLNIEEVVTSDFLRKLPESSPILPERFFNISTTLKIFDKTEKKKTGEKEGRCGKKSAIYSDVDYRYLRLPDKDAMGKEWSNTIQQAKNNLWIILCDWSIEQLEEASDLFIESVKKISDLAERVLNEQLNLIQEKSKLEQHHSQSFELQKDIAIQIHIQLQLICQ